VYKDEILDAKFAEDMKQKPIGFIEKGALYLSAKGLARKGSGSYYTPDEIVTFLVKKGLEPHFKAREEAFKADLQRLPPVGKARNFELEKKCTDDFWVCGLLILRWGAATFWWRWLTKFPVGLSICYMSILMHR
jgi:hypothetical protein